MDGLPVTVRLLDPPLHEFLPDLDELIAGEARGELDAEHAGAPRRRPALAGAEPDARGAGRAPGRAPARASTAPRSGPCWTPPEARTAAGGTPIIEVMIPLVVVREELALARSWVEEELAARPATPAPSTSAP